MSAVARTARKARTTRLPPIPKLAVEQEAVASVRTATPKIEKKTDWNSITERLVAQAGEQGGMPRNLRIVPYEPKDARYHGICSLHRELYEKLRAE